MEKEARKETCQKSILSYCICIFSIGFMLLSILFNPFFISYVFSSDHSLENKTIIGILFFELFLFFLGFFLYRYRIWFFTRRKEILLLFSTILITSFFLILTLEITLRLNTSKEWVREAIIGGNHPQHLFVSDPDTIYVLQPNFESRDSNIYGDFDIPVSINSIGFRDFERNISDCDSIILGIGDSFTYGEGVFLNETYLAILEQQLNSLSQDDICIVKAGIPGYGINQMALLYKKLSQTYPHTIVFVGYIPQDLEREKSGFVEYNGWAVLERWLPVIHTCPNGLLYIEKEWFNMIHEFLSCHSAVYPFFLDNKVLKQPLSVLYPYKVPPPLEKEINKTAENYFLQMIETANNSNATIITGLFCENEGEDTGDTLAEFFASHNTTHFSFPCEKDLFFEHDKHWNQNGHAEAAQIIFPYFEDFLTKQ